MGLIGFRVLLHVPAFLWHSGLFWYEQTHMSCRAQAKKADIPNTDPEKCWDPHAKLIVKTGCLSSIQRGSQVSFLVISSR